MMRWNSVTGIFIICSDSTLARFFLSSSKVCPMHSSILGVLMLQVDNCKSSLLPVFTKIKKKKQRFIWLLSLDALVLQWQSWIVATDTVWSTRLKMFAIWPFTEKVWPPLLWTLLGECILDEYMQSLFLLLTVKNFNWHKWISSSIPLNNVD